MLKLVSCATKCSSISSRSFTRIVSPCWLATPDDRRRDHQHYLPHHKRLSSSSTVSSKLLISHLTPVRVFSTSPIVPAKDGTWSRIKQMVRDYWYVIIPVEISLSVVSYAAIFLSLKSGVDIVQILTNIGVSQETLRLENIMATYFYIYNVFLTTASCLRPVVTLATTPSPSSATR